MNIFLYLCAIFAQADKIKCKKRENMNLLQTITEYRRLGIAEQIDYKKFYLYSIITHSTALSMDSENENYIVGPYEEIKPR